MAYNTDTTGNAGSADKLKTARTVQVDLGATGAASFDGSANISPGVTGSLPQSSVTNLTSDLSGKVTSGGALGTPSSGTLTNCTGLPLAGLASAAYATAATASTLAQRDANANLTADAFIATAASTATAAGTTTLTIDDAQTQVFTGTSTQTVRLPTTGVVAGQSYTIVNNSTGNVTVQSSGGNSVFVVGPSRINVFVALVNTPTAAANWNVIAGTGSNSGAASYSTAMRDASGFITAAGFAASGTSTATAGGSTSLSSASFEVQVFTGSTTQTCVLPGSGLSVGRRYTIINNSTGAVTVNASGGATVLTLPGGTSAVFVALQATPTTAAHWSTMTVPVANITASTTAALGVGSIELGHASDTTLTRSSAGILAVEGIVIPTATDVLGNELDSGESTFNRFLSSGSTSLTNGLLRLSFFTARKTETIASVRLTAAVAQAGATLVRVGIYSVDGSGNLTLVASTESDTTLLSAVQSYTKALSSSWSKTRGTRYAAGVLVVGSTTTGSVGAHVNGSGDSAIAPRISAAISGQTDLPASINSGSLAATTGLPYIAFIP